MRMRGFRTAMTKWKPLEGRVTWDRRPLVSFRQSRSEIERELGPPQERDADSNGVGLMDIWALHFDCGLELLLLAFHIERDFDNEISWTHQGWVELQANTTDFEHVASHLPFELNEISPWVPDRRTSPPPRWRVMRQDDNGHVFLVQAFAPRCAAEAALERLERLTHKQSYWLTTEDAGTLSGDR